MEFFAVDALREFLQYRIDANVFAAQVAVTGPGAAGLDRAAHVTLLERLRDPVDTPPAALSSLWPVSVLAEQVRAIPRICALRRATWVRPRLPESSAMRAGRGRRQRLAGPAHRPLRPIARLRQSWAQGTGSGQCAALVGDGGRRADDALDPSDPLRQDAGMAALEAGSLGFVAATGLKTLVGRSRPSDGQGARHFNWLHGSGDASLPSRHARRVQAAVTPFARAYDAPWLYGVAALTNAARVAGRDHWFSDTVAGGLIGYGLGVVMQDAVKERRDGGWSWQLLPNGLTAHRTW
jgi:hypothetical protein